MKSNAISSTFSFLCHFMCSLWSYRKFFVTIPWLAAAILQLLSSICSTHTHLDRTMHQKRVEALISSSAFVLQQFFIQIIIKLSLFCVRFREFYVAKQIEFLLLENGGKMGKVRLNWMPRFISKLVEFYTYNRPSLYFFKFRCHFHLLIYVASNSHKWRRKHYCSFSNFCFSIILFIFFLGNQKPFSIKRMCLIWAFTPNKATWMPLNKLCSYFYNIHFLQFSAFSTYSSLIFLTS